MVGLTVPFSRMSRMGGGLLTLVRVASDYLRIPDPGVFDTDWLFLGVARDRIRLAYLMVSTGYGATGYRNLTSRKTDT